MKRLWCVTAGALLLLALGCSKDREKTAAPSPATASSAATSKPQPSVDRSRYPGVQQGLKIIDVHVHLSASAGDRLEALMQRYNFHHVVNLSGGHPLGELQQQLETAKRHPGRITVFTTLAYEQAQRPGYGERMAELVRMAHSQGARGLKIAKVLGVGLAGPDGQLLPVDDPNLDIVFETAGELNMPVAIHSGDPKAFWDPVDPKNERFDELSAHPGWALYGKSVPSFDAILDQLEHRIARHPKTQFISVHFGNCAEDPNRVARMLAKYPNLYIDTAARIPEMGRHSPKEMREFFEKFQDRILYGSDLGVGPGNSPLFLGSQGAKPPTAKEQELFFTATRRYFETDDRSFAHPTPIQGKWTIDGLGLPKAILKKIYYDNAAKLLGLPN